MGFALESSVPAFFVFIQGLLSFFSPCVLPLVPLYIGYLTGGAKTTGEDGIVHYKRGKVMLHTVFFVLGISFTFFLLGLGFTALGTFFTQNKTIFARISGIFIILFGLIQIGFLDFKFLNREFRLPFKLNNLAMNPITALLLGFTFSFAWTPCLGPALTSVLLMASSAKTATTGFFLIGLYTLGFVLPFLVTGLFTGTLLNFFKKHQKGVQYTVKIGGVLMIIIGIMTFTGWMNSITGYLSQFPGATGTGAPASSSVAESKSTQTKEESKPNSTPATENKKENTKTVAAPDFTLVDQFGETHTLSDYKGKVVFLNFWATWCPPCRQEMPDIQKLYEESGGNTEDLIILGVSNPRSAEYPNGNDVPADEIAQFMEDNGYSYPTVMDTTGQVHAEYGISAFPTTFMIDKEGNVKGYVPGALTRDMMNSIVQQTLEGK